MTSVSENDVINALRKVNDPELHQDLVSLGMIHEIKVKDGSVSFQIKLTTPACPLKSKIEADAKAAVLALPGVKIVSVKMDSEVRGDPKLKDVLPYSIKYSIAVASGKGGVGKSTVAVNLAIALAKTGAKVGLLDADIYGPNIPTMMGIESLPEPTNNKLTPAEKYGVKVMSIGFLVPPGQALIWRGPMLHTAIKQFLHDVDWGDLDYLVIDLPPGTGDAQLSLAQNIPLSGGVIVTLPQQVSVDDASRGLQMFQTLNVPILGVVENMSYLVLADGSQVKVFGEGGGQRLADAANVAFLGQIPMDPTVREGGDSGKPVIVASPETAAAKAFEIIAGKTAAALSVNSTMSESSAIKLKVIE